MTKTISVLITISPQSLAVHLGDELPQLRGVAGVKHAGILAEPLFADRADLIDRDFSFFSHYRAREPATPTRVQF